MAAASMRTRSRDSRERKISPDALASQHLVHRPRGPGGGGIAAPDGVSDTHRRTCGMEEHAAVESLDPVGAPAHQEPPDAPAGCQGPADAQPLGEGVGGRPGDLLQLPLVDLEHVRAGFESGGRGWPRGVQESDDAQRAGLGQEAPVAVLRFAPTGLPAMTRRLAPAIRWLNSRLYSSRSAGVTTGEGSMTSVVTPEVSTKVVQQRDSAAIATHSA